MINKLESRPLGKNPNLRFCPECGTELESFGEHSYHKCAGCLAKELTAARAENERLRWALDAVFMLW